VLIAGYFNAVNDVPRNNIARLNNDSSLDASFSVVNGLELSAIALQGDGKIIMGGYFTAVNGVPRNSIARIGDDILDIDDGMPDWFEDKYGLNKLINDANGDLDNDGLSNIEEFNRRTWPDMADTDGDGFKDGEEVTYGTSPWHAQNLLMPGAAHTCAKDNNGVRCWGAGTGEGGIYDNGQSIVPAMTNPYWVSTYTWSTCALHDGGASCWGANWHGQTTVPALSNPRWIAAGDFNSCAIDDSGIKCWGRATSGLNTIPAGLDMPVMVWPAGDHACALDVQDGVVCWGDNVAGAAIVPVGLINPRLCICGR